MVKNGKIAQNVENILERFVAIFIKVSYDKWRRTMPCAICIHMQMAIALITVYDLRALR